MQQRSKTVFKCPQCGQYITRSDLNLKGKFFRHKISLHKYIIAQKLPSYPKITKCQKCDKIFWLNLFRRVGSYNNYMFDDDLLDEDDSSKDSVLYKIFYFLFGCKPKWENAGYAQFLYIEDNFKVLDINPPKIKSRLIYIRLNILLGYNDRIWDNKPLFQSKEDQLKWKYNIDQLILLIETLYSDMNKLLVAELHRNIGEFDKCTELLNNITDERLHWLTDTIRKECINKNSNVILLDLG